MRQNQSLNVSWTKWMKTRLVEEVIKDMAYFSLSFELQRDKSHASEFFGVRVCVYVCGGGDVPWQRNGMGFKEGCGNSPDKSGDEMGRRLGIQSTCKKPWALGTLRETVATSVLKHVSCWSPGRIAQSGGGGGSKCWAYKSPDMNQGSRVWFAVPPGKWYKAPHLLRLSNWVEMAHHQAETKSVFAWWKKQSSWSMKILFLYQNLKPWTAYSHPNRSHSVNNEGTISLRLWDSS